MHGDIRSGEHSCREPLHVKVENPFTFAGKRRRPPTSFVFGRRKVLQSAEHKNAAESQQMKQSSANGIHSSWFLTARIEKNTWEGELNPKGKKREKSDTPVKSPKHKLTTPPAKRITKSCCSLNMEIPLFAVRRREREDEGLKMFCQNLFSPSFQL